MKRSLCLVLCLLLVCGCNKKEKLQYAAPLLIPDTQRQMKSPGFWISRQANPDKLILDAQEISELNFRIQHKLKLTRDLNKLGAGFSGKELKALLESDFQNLAKEKLYFAGGNRAGKDFYRTARERMRISAIPAQVIVRYGFTLAYADQRLLPAADVLSAEPGDLEFDELQNSSLDIATPLAVLQESKDGAWVYALAPSSSGWVRKDKVAFCSFAEFESAFNQDKAAVVISAKTDIFWDVAMTRYYDYVRMGSVFRYIAPVDYKTAMVMIPFQDAAGKFYFCPAYINKQDLSIGYLPYTPRMIIIQAFKLLNAPYGWGGVNGEQDCSSFLQEIFSTVGINLPRNSADQGKVGELIGDFHSKPGNQKKAQILVKQGLGGITILQLKGHILLYLGKSGRRFYAIHETHGYGQKEWHGTVARILNRVAVTDLLLGKGSKKGSLIERIVAIRIIK